MFGTYTDSGNKDSRWRWQIGRRSVLLAAAWSARLATSCTLDPSTYHSRAGGRFSGGGLGGCMSDMGVRRSGGSRMEARLRYQVVMRGD